MDRNINRCNCHDFGYNLCRKAIVRWNLVNAGKKITSLILHEVLQQSRFVKTTKLGLQDRCIYYSEKHGRLNCGIEGEGKLQYCYGRTGVMV